MKPAIPLRDAESITGYHAHVYFDPLAREVANALREAIAARFRVEVGRIFDGPCGPHLRPMYQVAFGPDELARVLPWLMLNRRGLSVLIHPRTGDEVADHASNALWLGAPVPIDLEFIRSRS